MKPCPFCGTPSDGLHIALLRVVCSTCGASGPVGGDPCLTWDVRIRTRGTVRVIEDLEEREISEMLRQLGSTLLLDDEIRVDGSIESIHMALDRIFHRKCEQ